MTQYLLKVEVFTFLWKITDPYQFYYYLFDYKLATHYKKPVVLLPNSIGPLKNKIAKRMLEKTFK